MKRLLIPAMLFAVLFAGASLYGQRGKKETATPSLLRDQSWEHHQNLKMASLFQNMTWKNVGPTFQGGRISSITVHPQNPFTIYVSAGAGNLWKTVNNCTTWEPIFENESTFCIGDIAISRSNPDILWVGSGEDLMARSSYAGTGVFKSSDGGKTWLNMGLQESHHIGRIVIHPDKPEIVYVAAIGHNYTHNTQRGLFKTSDGGQTWDKVLYVSDKAGVVEVVMDPSDPETLYAASWERDRKAWSNVESGVGSGIWKTRDGGITWEALKNGLPSGQYVGRIGLDICSSKPDVIYALLDNQAARPDEGGSVQAASESALTILQIQKMSKEIFLKIDPSVLATFLEQMNVPRQYAAEAIFELIRSDELTPEGFARYLLDQHLDRKLHVTDVIGGEVYRSADAGASWQKVNVDYLDQFFSTYGYSFCDIRVSPDDPDQVYILGIRMFRSDDGGKHFKQIAQNCHVDHHDLWIDPENPGRILLGNDGGLDISYDRGETWQAVSNLPIAEFYTVSVDSEKPYNIYGGLQDNGTVFGPSDHSPTFDQPDAWQRLGGGDGFFVFVDPIDADTIYYSSQFGPVQRVNRKTGFQKNIMPQAKIGEEPFRCNWMTPYIISEHNHQILYYGAHKLLKSYNRGDRWWTISPDLTNKKPYDDVPYSTITTISESPVRPGLLYVGTDDGNVWVTRNDGVKWQKINRGLPSGKWVSRLVASRYDPATVYVTLTGYRNDDFLTYVFASTGYGKNWQSLAANLPAESVNVIREDPKVKGILYLGTDLGVYLSIDGGREWHSLCNHLPTTAVHDLVIHPVEGDLIIATHGRGVYRMNVTSIQEMVSGEMMEKGSHIFSTTPLVLPEGGRQGINGSITFYLDVGVGVLVEILDGKERLVARFAYEGSKGLNVAEWNLEKQIETGRMPARGRCKLRITVGEKKLEAEIEVK